MVLRAATLAAISLREAAVLDPSGSARSLPLPDRRARIRLRPVGFGTRLIGEERQRQICWLMTRRAEPRSRLSLRAKRGLPGTVALRTDGVGRSGCCSRTALGRR